MPYTKQINDLEVEISVLEDKLNDLRIKQAEVEEKESIFIIETGLCDAGKPYLVCEQLPTWYDLSDIDSEIEDAIETNKANGFKEWSFRLANKAETEYGLSEEDGWFGL
ncbi:hypothetical protein FLAPJACK_200 [Bacillus phage Flapjack]|uniref:Uncharacterized protein n=1 Tax=Bacillus phage Flapjack TaxID=1983465 RepID=A0A1X9SG63_9CAUD|nr:hypothetical protein FLAPJACK_200 [Bacillus phage Flapjack]